MKKKILVMIALMLVVTMSLSSCGAMDWLKGFWQTMFGAEIELTDAPLNADMLIDFADGANPDVLFESDGWSNGDVFNVVWKSHNVHYENGIMRLGITEEEASAWIDGAEVPYNYTAGEARSQNYYHYGDYEVSMKPSANGGTASTFFVCTGPYDLKDGVPNAHDEIDIEFLGNNGMGKDTTKVQFNFFVDGVGGNEFMYDLGFDASEEFHTYGFRWEENAITWFVDGEPVYKVTTDTSVQEGKNVRIVEKIPSTAGRILTNYWCGNERAWGWMGEYKGETHDNGTTYQWIKTSAKGAPLNPPVEPPIGGGEDTEIKWEDIDPIVPTFETTPEYVVAIDGNKANVTYTDVSGSAYKPIEMDVTEAVAGKNHVYLKVTNNGTETVNVRVNMFDPTLTGNNQATNISATMNGEAVRTDLDWGGSFFDIPAGESAELVIYFGVGATKLQLMIDSSRNDSVLRSGDVTVEDIKFAAVGEVEVPHKCEDLDNDGKCDGCGEDMPAPPPPAPADPVSGNLSTTIGGATVELGGNVTDGYGVHGNEDGTIRVEYTNISTNTYENVWAQISEVAAGKNEISLKIKNNGEATAYITVKIEAVGAVALMEGKMEIPAGEEHEFKGTFEGVADKLYFFIDSGWSMETTTHAGEVVISEIAFAGGEPTPEPVDPIVNVSDLTIETTTDEELIPGTGISASAGLAIDGNNKSIDGFNFTQRLKLGGTMKVADGVVAAGIQVVTNGPAKIVLYAISSSSSDSTRTLQLATLVDGALNKLAETEGVPGDAVVKLEFTVDAAGTYYIGSTKSGINVYYIAVEAASEPTPEPKPEPEPDTGLQFEFWTSSNDYTANGHNIKYNGAGNSYSCAGSDITSLAAGKTTFTVTITNNGTAASRVRIDIQGDTKVGNHKVLNTSATGGDVWTDAEWGGSSVTVEPGQSVTLVIEFDVNTERGKPVDLIVFVDAARGTADTYSSDITLSGMAFSGEAPAPEEPKPEDPKPEDPKPEEPKPEEPTVEYKDLYVEFKTENAYTLTTPDTYANQVRVTYSEIAQNSWSNINIWVADKSADCSIFTFKLTNNGAATVSVWVQMKDAAGAELINQNVDIAAGAEEVVTFNYTGTAQMIFFFVDSTHEADAATNAGDITMSELKLGKVLASEEPKPVEGEYLSFTGNECYTLHNEQEYVNSIQITYSAVSDNTYQNVNTWIQDKAAGKATLGVTIKNNGAETVAITVKLENGTGGAAETKVVLAAGESKTVELAYDFAPDLLYFFIDSGWAEATATHAGDVTISGINFK